MHVSTKIFKILYRLTLPGSLLLLIAALMIRVGVLAEPNSPTVRFFPLVLLGAGLALSAFFRRSRLFFAMVMLLLAHIAFAWIVPHLAATSARVVSSAIALLLPLNLGVLVYLRERGIISPAGRRRWAWIAAEIVAVSILCTHWLAFPASYLSRAFVPLGLSRWSHLSQPALVVFMLASVAIIVPLIRRYHAIESSLLWTLVAAFVALRVGGSTPMAGVFFATGGMVLIVALIETSYSMAYLDELTQLPSRRALNEALLKLGDTYTIAMADVDHFKKFNDTYGHESGDQALRLVSSRLAHIAGGGKAYRYGGEEFALVFPGKLSEEVFVYLDRMRRVIEQSTFMVRGKDRRKGKRAAAKGAKKEINVTVSIGLASTNGDRLLPSEVLRMADQALYKAKAKGRNCVVTARIKKAPGSVQPRIRAFSAS